MREYGPVFVLGLVGFILALAIEYVSKVMTDKPKEQAKLEGYECGFESLESAMEKYDVKYYMIALLFIVYDIEAIYIYPWVVSMDLLSTNSMILLDFIVELIVGTIYLYKQRIFDLV